MVKRLSVLITGASSGIGKATALYLSSQGFEVFAGVRKSADGDALQSEAKGYLTPVLLDVLADRSVDMDAIIAVVRALGRIGDVDATVPALLKLLERDDLPRNRTFQQTNVEGRWPAGEDGLWQIELAVAEVLTTFGHPQPRVLEKYRDDARNHVRRYAHIVAERA